MNTALRAALLTLLLALAPAAPAGDDAPPLDAFLDQLRSLQADFLQTVYDEDGRPQQQSSGRLFMRRPGRFRWDYSEPFAQTIVADGERLWLYDRDLEQITVTPLENALGAAPLALLSGAEDVGARFGVADSAYDGDAGLWRYRLLPRDNGGGEAGLNEFTELHLALAEAAGGVLELRGVELVDSFGRRTALRFDKVRSNRSLADGLFVFTPPDGVDVIEN